MVDFNELRVSPDRKNLIIDVSIKDLSYYENVYIDSIIIDTQDTYIPSGPSNSPIFTYEVVSNVTPVYSLPDCGCNQVQDYIDKENCFETSNNEEKRVRLELDNIALNNHLKGNLFFIYVITKGTPASDTPCNMDNTINLGVTADTYPIYTNMLNSLKELESCSTPKLFTDAFLRFKAFELSIKTGQYSQVINYWNKYFKSLDISNNTNCSCNGRT